MKSACSYRLLVLLVLALVLCSCNLSDNSPRNSDPKKISPDQRMGPRKGSQVDPGGTDLSNSHLTRKVNNPKQLASISPSQVPQPKETVPLNEKITGYQTPAEYFTVNSINYDGTVAVTLPLDYNRQKNKTYPLLIVFGGAGECAKPPRQGALAWLHYYKTDEAITALHRKKLENSDFRGLATPGQLIQYNTALRNHPYQDMIIACPSSPLLTPGSGPEFPYYEEYIMNEVLPALVKHYRVNESLIGVDGVSMGGARSMYYGLKYPEIFSSIGAIQGAFGAHLDLYQYLIKVGKSDLKRRHIQLVTSDKDVLLPSNERMHKLLSSSGIPHDYQVLHGPHDYIFNQGPGAISLLVFHSRALHTSQ